MVSLNSQSLRTLMLLACVSALGFAVACGDKKNEAKIDSRQAQPNEDLLKNKLKGYQPLNERNMNLANRVLGVSANVAGTQTAAENGKRLHQVKVSFLVNDLGDGTQISALKVIQQGEIFPGQNDLKEKAATAAGQKERAAKLVFLADKGESSDAAKGNYLVEAMCEGDSCEILLVRLFERIKPSAAEKSAAAAKAAKSARAVDEPETPQAKDPVKAPAPEVARGEREFVVIFKRKEVKAPDAAGQATDAVYQIAYSGPIGKQQVAPDRKNAKGQRTRGIQNTKLRSYEEALQVLNGAPVSEVPAQPRREPILNDQDSRLTAPIAAPAAPVKTQPPAPATTAPAQAEQTSPVAAPVPVTAPAVESENGPRARPAVIVPPASGN